MGHAIAQRKTDADWSQFKSHIDLFHIPEYCCCNVLAVRRP